MGQNLGGVSEVLFGTVPASINTTFRTNEMLVIQVPEVPFHLVPADNLHEVIMVGKEGMTTFSIKIVGPPSIMRVRNFAPAPNDTIITSAAPGQQVNLIGFNLQDATEISFQGVEIDLSTVVYTDSSAIVTVPEDFTNGDATLANRISYTTSIGNQIFFIPIFDPAVLEYYKDPLWTLLTGGIGSQKTWAIDFNAAGESQVFPGPLWFSGDELRYERACASEGGNCWWWEPTWQSWMPGPKDYGTMTFKLNRVPVIPRVAVTQKGLDAAKNGDFSGDFFLDVEAKTITFTGLTPLNMGWDNVDWSKAYIITLTEEGMQLGFKNKSKAEFELYSFIPN
jgi:hypothetical protein